MHIVERPRASTACKGMQQGDILITTQIMASAGKGCVHRRVDLDWNKLNDMRELLAICREICGGQAGEWRTAER